MADTLAASLVDALAELTVLEATRTAKIETNKGRDYSYKYADIAAAVKVTRPVLAKHGIVALTPVHGDGDDLAVTVIFLHFSGERETFPPFPFPHGRDAQATGSMVTYHRRYALIAALGMAAGEDDDGAAAKPRERRSAPKQPKPFDVAQFKGYCETNGLDPLDVVAHSGVNKELGELTADDRQSLMDAIAEMSKPPARTGDPASRDKSSPSAGGEKRVETPDRSPALKGPESPREEGAA